IQFGRLSHETIKSIVDKFLIELQAQLEDKRVLLEVSDDARGWLATTGYDVQMGARPMARRIQDKSKRPLAEEILFGELAEHGGVVRVGVASDELVLEFETRAELAWDQARQTKKPGFSRVFSCVNKKRPGRPGACAIRYQRAR